MNTDNEAYLAGTVVSAFIAIVLLALSVRVIADDNALRRERDDAKAAAAISQRAAEDLWATLDRIAQHQQPE